MKSIRSIFIILIALSISCKLRYDDLGGYRIATNTEMGDELILTKSDTTSIYFFNDTTSVIAPGAYLNFWHGNKRTMFIWKETTVIQSHINEVNNNDQFILVDQKPLDSIFGSWVKRPHTSSSYRPNMPEHHGKAELMLKRSNIHNYWIIVKARKDIYGPFNKKEYLQKREELGVPKDLELNK